MATPPAPRHCQVCRCELHASECAYSFKRRICAVHACALSIKLPGCEEAMRFCQQCGRVEPVSKFSGSQRSCLASLQRRREAVAMRRRASTAEHAPLRYTGHRWPVFRARRGPAVGATASAGTSAEAQPRPIQQFQPLVWSGQHQGASASDSAGSSDTCDSPMPQAPVQLATPSAASVCQPLTWQQLEAEDDSQTMLEPGMSAASALLPRGWQLQHAGGLHSALSYGDASASSSSSSSSSSSLSALAPRASGDSCGGVTHQALPASRQPCEAAGACDEAALAAVLEDELLQAIAMRAPAPAPVLVRHASCGGLPATAQAQLPEALVLLRSLSSPVSAGGATSSDAGRLAIRAQPRAGVSKRRPHGRVAALDGAIRALLQSMQQALDSREACEAAMCVDGGVGGGPMPMPTAG